MPTLLVVTVVASVISVVIATGGPFMVETAVVLTRGSVVGVVVVVVVCVVVVVEIVTGEVLSGGPFDRRMGSI